jgi:hypothetical protein
MDDIKLLAASVDNRVSMQIDDRRRKKEDAAKHRDEIKKCAIAILKKSLEYFVNGADCVEIAFTETTVSAAVYNERRLGYQRDLSQTSNETTDRDKTVVPSTIGAVVYESERLQMLIDNIFDELTKIAVDIKMRHSRVVPEDIGGRWRIHLRAFERDRGIGKYAKKE